MSYEEEDQPIRKPHDVLTCLCLVCELSKKVPGWAEMTDAQHGRFIAEMFRS